MSARVAVVVPAGGSGRRMGGIRKQYLELFGEPVLVHALRPFLEHPAVEWVVVALPAEDLASPPAWLSGMDTRIRLVAGGQERGDSVRAALEAVPGSADVVLVHDAARPLVSGPIIDRALAAAVTGVGAVVAVPLADTLKEVGADQKIHATRDRSRLWRAQTPQAFPRAMLVEAYRRALSEGYAGTDDASLVERIGGEVVVVEGAEENIKVTRPADVRLAEAFLRDRAGVAAT